MRWLFHVHPDRDSFRLEFPGVENAATDLPGAVNTTKGAEQKALLTFMMVPLVSQPDGSFDWPEGWQWTFVLLLAKPLSRTNTAVKIHKPDLRKGTLQADQVEVPVADWAVLGHLPPDEQVEVAGFSQPLLYGEAGRAIVNLLRPSEGDDK